MALSDFQSIVDDLVRDDAQRITPMQRDTTIVSALARYSKDRNRFKVEDVLSAGGKVLPTPAGWEPGVSALVSLEYPIGEMPPRLIDTQSFSVYQEPTGFKLIVSESLPANASVRATYTVAHVVDLTNDSVPLADREPVCCLAAASLCDQLAALYSGDGDSTIQADSVNHRSKAGEFAARAKALRKRYLDELGLMEKKNVAAGVVVQMDGFNSQGGPRLTHRRGRL